MPFRLLLIALSLAANAAFGVVLWQRHSRTAPIVPASPSSSLAASANASASSPAEIPATAIWNYLTDNSTDHARLVTRLRAEGFPKSVVRLIVQRRVRERFADQYSALVQKESASPYWIRTNYSSTNPENRAARRALDSQVNDLARTLLGSDADRQPGEPGFDDPSRLYGDIPAEKISRLEAIAKDYGELSSAIQESSLGITLSEDREKLRFLENEKRADLAALLTPDELEQYDRRNSPSAQQVRQHLRHFDSTEAEFLALYQIQASFDRRYGRESDLSPGERNQRNAARKELEPQIQAALGPERYAEYQTTTHIGYRMNDDFVTGAGLPPATTRSLVTLQRETERERDALRADRSLNRDQRNAALADLEKIATEKVTSIVGANRIETYKSQPGYWLRNIAPTAPTPVRTP